MILRIHMKGRKDSTTDFLPSMANYFAVNANYSHGYSYVLTSGRHMFLVKVLMGDSYECQSNSSLRMPPEKARGANTEKFSF